MYADKNIPYFNEDSGDAVFSCSEMGILSIDLNNINLDNNFDEDDSDTIILIKILTRHSKLRNVKHLIKYKWRIKVACVVDIKLFFYGLILL